MTVALIKYPPTLYRADGQARRVGVELEFAGLTLAEAAALVVDRTALRQEPISDYEIKLTGDAAGDWHIERDQDLLKRMGRERAAAQKEPGFLATTAEKALDLGSQALVPLEIVSPPLDFDRLPECQDLVGALRDAGAVGTEESVLFAFALQLNPELPNLETPTITRYLQSFGCLQDWLAERCNIDAARKITDYSALYPSAYLNVLLDSAYAPNQAQLIDDYLEHNPTRNRALDMLPLFSYLDKERVAAKVPDRKIKSRPTFHYRLPNSEVGKPGWTIFEAWTDWVTVEEIADSPAQLKGLVDMRSSQLREPFGEILADSAAGIDRWLRENR